MAGNLPIGSSRITAYLLYQDVSSTIDWLIEVFGFSERSRSAGPDGSVWHAELDFGGALVMMGCPGPDYRNPRTLGGVTQSLYIYVDDVDAHYAHACEAGAKIIQEPTDMPYGDRRYGAEDPEGHHWYFAAHMGEAVSDNG